MLIASFGLIASRGSPIQLDAAVKYGFLNFLATTLFLLALGLLYGLLGTLNMADIIGKAGSANPAAMTAVAALLLLAFGMKAAAFPVNAWLPASYHAPPAAVAALFAGLLTKVGLYALLRSLVMLLPASRDLLEPVIALVAIGSMLLGPLSAIGETNLRRAIGFLLIGGIGVAMVGIALGGLGGVSGAGIYIVHSMITLSALYLTAGLIEQATGQSDVRQMGSLYASNTALSVLFLILVLAVAGVPPLLGFWPKLILLQASIANGGVLGGVAAVALVLNAVLTTIAGTRIWAHVFWREGETAKPGIAAPATARDGLRYGAATVMAGLVVALGLWPNFLLAAARLGAADLLDPTRYIAAIGLMGSTP
jgi:multicomponent Na+:H+ antiporter subunit D